MDEKIYLDFRDSKRIGRKLLQQSTMNASQTSFIILISVISFLIVLIAVLIFILVYRFCFRPKKAIKRPKAFKPILSYPDEPIQRQRTAISTSSISTVPGTIRSHDGLVSTRPAFPIDKNRLNQKSNLVDNYLKDVEIVDPKKLDPFLFIDLHSTSSETFPESRYQQIRHRSNLNNTTTSGYHTTTVDDEHVKKRSTQTIPHRSWRQIARKPSNRARFLVRERILPTNLPRLPQLRQENIISIEKNPSDTSGFSNNQENLSTNVSMTTNDYDESHAYHVHQQQIMQTIREEKENHHRAQYVEVVSTYRGDESDLPAEIPLKNAPVINDSIIV